MGTNIISYDDIENTGMNVLLKRYWGGSDDGTMCQISEKNVPFKHINISDKELMFVIYMYLKHLYDEIQDKDTLYDGHAKFCDVVVPLLDYLKGRYGF